MKLKQLTTLLVVEDIEACLGTWQKLGYEVTVPVPETGPLGFAVQLAGGAGQATAGRVVTSCSQRDGRLVRQRE